MTTTDGTLTTWSVMHWMEDFFTSNFPAMVMRERLQGIPDISAVNSSGAENSCLVQHFENKARKIAAASLQNLIILLIESTSMY